MSEPLVPAVDLAVRTLGGSVLAASDESFGFKERLVDPAEPAFVPGTYDQRGEVVDGWETRRHAGPDGDWAIVRLGVPGRLRAVDVDTRFFTGNHPTACRIDACVLNVLDDPTDAGVAWQTVVETTVLKPDSHNLLCVDDPRRFTHVRLMLESDGGVARLRVYGDVVPDPDSWADVTVEVSGVEQGGRVDWSSDNFYSNACVLISPDRPRNMGDGWETRRRRDVGTGQPRRGDDLLRRSRGSSPTGDRHHLLRLQRQPRGLGDGQQRPSRRRTWVGVWSLSTFPCCREPGWRPTPGRCSR